MRSIYATALLVLLVALSQVSMAIAVAKITSLSPTSGIVGTPVTITGTGFGQTQRTSTVTFEGGGPKAPVTFWSDTRIDVTVPGGSTATGNVTVTVSGVTSNGGNFTVLPKDQDSVTYFGNGWRVSDS